MALLRIVSPVVAVFVTILSGAGTASAHYIDEDSVDCSSDPCEIRYENYSKYDLAHNNAIDEWEGLVGGVKIGPDTASSINDLELNDYNENDGRCGYWDPRIGSDLINMNDYYMGGYDVRDRKACVIHEWGHAHRLDHSYDGQVMDDCPVSACGSTFIQPQGHDRSDYHGIW